MYAEQIDVISYSGSKDDERPVTFNLRGQRIDVVEILDRGVEKEFGSRFRKRHFRIEGSDGNTYRLYYDDNILKWYYSS